MEFIFVCLWYARHPGLTHDFDTTHALLLSLSHLQKGTTSARYFVNSSHSLGTHFTSITSI